MTGADLKRRLKQVQQICSDLTIRASNDLGSHDDLSKRVEWLNQGMTKLVIYSDAHATIQSAVRGHSRPGWTSEEVNRFATLGEVASCRESVRTWGRHVLAGEFLQARMALSQWAVDVEAACRNL